MAGDAMHGQRGLQTHGRRAQQGVPVAKQLRELESRAESSRGACSCTAAPLYRHNELPDALIIHLPYYSICTYVYVSRLFRSHAPPAPHCSTSADIALRDQVAALRDSTHDASARLDAAIAAAVARGSELASRAEADIAALHRELQATGVALADGVVRAADNVVERTTLVAEATAARARADAAADILPSLTMLADEVRSAGAAALPAVREHVAEAAAAVAARVDSVAGELGGVARSVGDIEAAVQELAELIRAAPPAGARGAASPRSPTPRRSNSEASPQPATQPAPPPAPPPPPPSGDMLLLEASTDDEASAASLGQVYPLPADDLRANAALEAASRAATVVGYYAVAAPGGSSNSSSRRTAAERAFSSTAAASTAATARSTDGSADALERAGGDALPASHFAATASWSVPLPRLGGSGGGASLRGGSASGGAAIMAAATSTGDTGSAALAEADARGDGDSVIAEGGRTVRLPVGVASAATATATASSSAAACGSASGASLPVSRSEQYAGGVVLLQQCAGGTGPLPLQELDIADLSSGEVVLAEDFSVGELVEIIPITRGIP